MPVFRLSKALLFPPVEYAEPEGILAVGGDLSPERLLLAYRSGIFPWYSESQPILWWSPDPRFVFFTATLTASTSMRKVLRKKEFDIRIDTCFAEVIEKCSTAPREGQDGTWITAAMKTAYCRMHALGYAHSIEAWRNGELVGGLYGISLGRIFFGESMFSTVTNSSKAAFLTFGKALLELGIPVIDSQVGSPHTESLGGRNIPRTEYLEHLGRALEHPDIIGTDFREALGQAISRVSF